MNPEDVVDTAHARAFSKEGELCLRILAKLDALVRCADDICLAQELLRDELPRPDSAVRQCFLLCTSIPRRWRNHSCSTKDKFRCFHVAETVYFGRNRCHLFIVRELMEYGQGLSATWSANSDLPHRGREGCDLSFTEDQP